MKHQVRICYLSAEFFKKYPLSDYPEIMCKITRPYACLIIETHKGYKICVPFRSSIQHNEAFIFKRTKRSEHTRSGLDYKKTIIINNDLYLEKVDTATVDNDEYIAMMKNISVIENDVDLYIRRYIDHINGTTAMHPKEFTRKYKYSTLPYFHDILGIG